MLVLVFTGIMHEKSTLPRDSKQEVRCQRRDFQETPKKALQKKKRKERKPKNNNLKNKQNKPKA